MGHSLHLEEAEGGGEQSRYYSLVYGFIPVVGSQNGAKTVAVESIITQISSHRKTSYAAT
jgi:hypothetical protein